MSHAKSEDHGPERRSRCAPVETSRIHSEADEGVNGVMRSTRPLTSRGEKRTRCAPEDAAMVTLAAGRILVGIGVGGIYPLYPRGGCLSGASRVSAVF